MSTIPKAKRMVAMIWSDMPEQLLANKVPLERTLSAIRRRRLRFI